MEDHAKAIDMVQKQEDCSKPVMGGQQRSRIFEIYPAFIIETPQMLPDSDPSQEGYINNDLIIKRWRIAT